MIPLAASSLQEASMVRKNSRLMYYTILRSLKANPNQTDVVTEYLG